MLPLLLLPSALNLRLPHTPAPAVRSAVAASRTGSLVLMAKKKQKMKAPKGVAASLAALDAWEANLGAPGGGGDDIVDPLAPVVAKKGKMTSKGQKKDVPVEEEDPDAPLLVAEAGAAPMAAAAPAASPVAAAPATLADKVARIKLELGLDEALPLAPAVTAANEAMGLGQGGSIADQVAELLMQLSIEM